MSAKKYSVSELQPGMMLSQPVVDDNGRIVMPEGSRLTPMYIKRLAKWEIESVTVVTDENTATLKALGVEPEKPETKEISPEEKAAMRNIAGIVAERFHNLDADDSIMNELKRLTVRHLVIAYQAGESVPGIHLKA